MNGPLLSKRLQSGCWRYMYAYIIIRDVLDWALNVSHLQQFQHKLRNVDHLYISHSWSIYITSLSNHVATSKDTDAE